jgi:HD-GYP domain-containing protein (c-di-GMP phosphodiesterase class II)
LNETLIAQEARIITVCDFYDALTADRPYRAAIPVEAGVDHGGRSRQGNRWKLL